MSRLALRILILVLGWLSAVAIAVVIFAGIKYPVFLLALPAAIGLTAVAAIQGMKDW